MRLVSQVRTTLNAEIGVREFFEAPTVAGVVAALERDASAAAVVRKTAEALVAVSELSDEEVEQMLAERART